MIAALNWIIDFVQSIVQFIVQLFTSLIQAITMLPGMITSLTGAVGYLPPILALFATLYITFLIVNYIIGRQGG